MKLWPKYAWNYNLNMHEIMTQICMKLLPKYAWNYNLNMHEIMTNRWPPVWQRTSSPFTSWPIPSRTSPEIPPKPSEKIPSKTSQEIPQNEEIYESFFFRNRLLHLGELNENRIVITLLWMRMIWPLTKLQLVCKRLVKCNLKRFSNDFSVCTNWLIPFKTQSVARRTRTQNTSPQHTLLLHTHPLKLHHRQNSLHPHLPSHRSTLYPL